MAPVTLTTTQRPCLQHRPETPTQRGQGRAMAEEIGQITKPGARPIRAERETRKFTEISTQT